MAEQAARLAYAHGSAFTTEPLEAYAARSAATCRWTTRRSIPCPAARRRSRRRSSSPGPTTSRAARPTADIVIARWGSYHGNTLGALDLSGRPPLRRPYEPWLGRFRHVSAAYPYRRGAARCARARRRRGAGRRARGGDRRGRAGHAWPRSSRSRSSARRSPPSVPPDDYWPAIADGLPPPRRPAHRRRGDDRVRADRALVRPRTTGASGRTSWSRPRARTSGYWPFGFVGRVGRDPRDRDRRAGGFVHGFTYSHSPVGAAVAREVLADPRDRGSRRGERGQGRAAARRCSRQRSATTRTSARSAAAA